MKPFCCVPTISLVSDALIDIVRFIMRSINKLRVR